MSTTRVENDSLHCDVSFRKRTKTTLTGITPKLYTAAMLLGGYIQRDANVVVVDNVDSAANIVSAMKAKNLACEVGSTFNCYLINNGAAGVSLVGGVGVFIFGDVLAVNSYVNLQIIIENDTPGSESVTILANQGG